MSENIVVMPENKTNGTFVNNDKRAFRAILWNIISPIATIVLVIVIVVTIVFLGISATGSGNSTTIWLSIVTGLLFLAVLAFIITSTVFYLQWVYRAHKNAVAISGKELFLSAGWHVGFHFIPLANIIVPYLLMLRIAEDSSSKESRTMVLIWWIAIIVSVVFSYGSIIFTLSALPGMLSSINADTVPVASATSGVESIFSGIANLASFTGFIVSFLVINSVTKGQKERAQELGMVTDEE